jgi:hypothetical protein
MAVRPLASERLAGPADEQHSTSAGRQMPTRNGSSIEATESVAERTVRPMVLVIMGVSGSGKSTIALEGLRPARRWKTGFSPEGPNVGVYCISKQFL